MNSKTIRYIMYTVIIIICLISIVIAVYAQFFMKEPSGNSYENDISAGGNQNLVTSQDVKQSFLDLFTNEFYSNQYTEQVSKLDDTKDIVYTAYSNTQTVDGKYSIDVNIPVINIKGDVPAEYNNISQSVFADKINAIMTNSTVYTVYNLDYTSYINNDILSVGIMATIKEGDNPQRIIVQTYNYNLKTGKGVTIQDILVSRGIEENVVNKKIENTIKKASEDANKMAESGYTVYQRDPNDEMYKLENINTFMKGPNGELYIIFAYGNNNFTSEMDVIEI